MADTCRIGDYTKEKYETPELALDEIWEHMRKIDPEQIERAEREVQ